VWDDRPRYGRFRHNGLIHGAAAAFLRFHLRVGACRAARILAPILAVIFIVDYILRAWFALALARAAERRFKPTVWAERRHLDAGDPLSWSAS